MRLWGMWSIPSLPLLLGPLYPGVVVPIQVLFPGQIELFSHLLRVIFIIIYLKSYHCVQVIHIR